MSPRLPQNAADHARRAPERAPQSAGVWPIRQSRQNDIASRFQRESRPPTKSRPTRFTCSRTGPKRRQRGGQIEQLAAFRAEPALVGVIANRKIESVEPSLM